MIETMHLLDGVTLRCVRDHRFKQAAISIQFVRPMLREEAALNALLPAVLLRGSKNYPDIRAITNRLDELYGASVGNIVRRVGDYQTTGFYCGFMEDRFALEGDRILVPTMELARELLLEPLTENGVFRRDFVEGEKKNLLAVIEAERNDKRAYANGQMTRLMCREDSFGIPRLGDKESVTAVTPESLYAHYQRVLRESRVDVFYVGAADAQTVADAVTLLFNGVDRDLATLPPQTGYNAVEPQEHTEVMDVSQGKLCMGFTTPVTLRDPEFVTMQLLNLIFGAGMTSKLFMQVREKLSLCYDIGSGYHGAKGIMSVSAGIDCHQKDRVIREIMGQLEACQNGKITEAELEAAKQAMYSSILSIHDSPGAIEGFYGTSALSGMALSPEQYRAGVERVTVEEIAAAAKNVKLHTVYFLKGVQ